MADHQRCFEAAGNDLIYQLRHDLSNSDSEGCDVGNRGAVIWGEGEGVKAVGGEEAEVRAVVLEKG